MNGIGCTAGSGNCFQNHQTGLFVISFSAFLILFQQLSLLIKKKKKERKTCHDVLSDESKVTVMAGNGGMDKSGMIQGGGGGGVAHQHSSLGRSDNGADSICGDCYWISDWLRLFLTVLPSGCL